MIRRKLIEWIAKQVHQWDLKHRTVLPDTGNTIYEAQAERYREKHRLLRAFDTVKLLLVAPVLILLVVVWNWLEGIGFGPWIRTKLGTGK